jgi:hypothetical protein
MRAAALTAIVLAMVAFPTGPAEVIGLFVFA